MKWASVDCVLDGNGWISKNPGIATDDLMRKQNCISPRVSHQNMREILQVNRDLHKLYKREKLEPKN
jgi:hypothetical protein